MSAPVAADAEAPARVDPAGVLDVLRHLPHRFPMLLVDRVEDIVPHRSARGIKGVTINEPFFSGHFPQRPIMPGVLIVEALAQTAGVLALVSIGAAARGKLLYFMGIEEAKFRRAVEPGCLLHLHVEVTQARGRVWKFDARAEADGEVKAEARFTAMVADPPASSD